MEVKNPNFTNSPSAGNINFTAKKSIEQLSQGLSDVLEVARQRFPHLKLYIRKPCTVQLKQKFQFFLASVPDLMRNVTMSLLVVFQIFRGRQILVMFVTTGYTSIILSKGLT